MRVIKEVKDNNGNKYYKVYFNDKYVQSVKILRVNKIHNGFQYMFLINSYGEVIGEVFEFLNSQNCIENYSVREQAMSALKLFYSFIEIINKKIEDFNWADITNLSNFILGLSQQGVIESQVLTTQRSIRTHDQYFDIIRKYLEYIEVNNKLFFKSIRVKVELDGNKEKYLMKYATNKGVASAHNIEVPKFIALEEYNKIIASIEKSKSKNKLRNSLIINLMYMRGLRLGEVLGITLEDIKAHPNNNKAGVLYIRNRVSDSKYQHAKTCIKVTSHLDYKSKHYKSEKEYGYQIVCIPANLMKQVRDYISESRQVIEEVIYKLPKEKIHQQLKNLEADCVEDGTRQNFYLFLNKNYTCLSQSGWSKELKKFFKEANIEIDRGTKENNLSHRFRHGFAMFLLEVMNKDIYYIKRQMRHKSIQSTLIYLNPTQKTVLEDTEMIVETIRESLHGNRCEELLETNLLDESESIERSINKFLKSSL